MYGEYSKTYSQWCEYYDFKNIELQTIRKYIDIQNKDIIDIGCGTGRFLFRLLPYIGSAVGVDNDAYSIGVLNDTLYQRHRYYASKVNIICSSIENVQIPSEAIDIAFFSWSLYALNEVKMKIAMKKVFDMLRMNGKLVILQPIDGEFESVMRLFFKEHADKDEYKDCIENMNKIVPLSFDFVAFDRIISQFIVPGLNEFCDMIKMFAIMEGGCDSNELNQISIDALNEQMSKFKRKEGFCLGDEVLLYIYEKKGD